MKSYNKKNKPKHKNKINPNVQRDIPVENRKGIIKRCLMFGLTFDKKESIKSMRKKYFWSIKNK